MSEEAQKPTEGMSQSERREHWQQWFLANSEALDTIPTPVDTQALSKDDIQDAAIAHSLVAIKLENILNSWTSQATMLINMNKMLNE